MGSIKAVERPPSRSVDPAKPPRATSSVPSVPPSPAPAIIIARGTEEVRINATYQNFRTAIATGNKGLRDALLPVLLRDRTAAVRLAELELARASAEADREIAQKTLEALRR